jgi:hypothetical protein
LPGLSDRFGPQLALALGRGVRLDGQQPRVQVGGFAAAAGGPAELGAIGGPALAEQQVVRLALDRLAWLEAEGLEGYSGVRDVTWGLSFPAACRYKRMACSRKD